MGQAASFPFTLGEERVDYKNDMWKLYDGTIKADGKLVSIFEFEKTKHGASRLEAAQNALQRLRVSRHPHILQFVDGQELPDRLFIVTERVDPLNLHADELKVEWAISLGLFQLITAVSFLSNECGVVHGNLSPQSVFVTPAGDWKLGGFDLSFKREAGVPPSTINNYDLVAPEYRAPEFGKRNWAQVTWAVDSWALGCLLYHIFNRNFSRQQQLQSPGQVPKSLIKCYGALLQTATHGRMNAKQVLTSSFFKNPLVHSVDFLLSLPMKSDAEKSAFFNELPKLLQSMPPRCLKYKVLPELTKCLDLGTAPKAFPQILGAVVEIGQQLSDSEYAETIVPSIVKLFSSNARAVRFGLLQNIAKYVQHIPQSVIVENVWKSIVSGFTDASAALRELTLKSLVHLVPVLPSHIVDSQVMKYLAALQTDKEPAVRTNTTLCLGIIARHLPEATQHKVLVSAFSRALRDPFPPARLSAISSFSSCVSLFSQSECASRIIPALAPYTMDNDGQVRDAAIQAIQTLLNRLNALSEKMKEAARAAGASVPAKDHQGKNTSKISSVSAQAAGAVLGVLGGFASKIVGGNNTSSSSEPANSQQQQQQQQQHPQQQRTTVTPPTSKHVQKDDDDDDFFGTFDNDEDGDVAAKTVSLSLKTSKPKKKEQRTRRAVVKKNTPQLQQGKPDEWDDLFSDPPVATQPPPSNMSTTDEWGDMLGDLQPVSTPVTQNVTEDDDVFASLSLGNKSKAKPRAIVRKKQPSITKAPVLQTKKTAPPADEDDWTNFLNS